MSNGLQAPIEIRDSTQEEHKLVYATWLRSQRKQGDRKYMRNRTYFQYEVPRLTAILNRSRCIIAANPEDPSHIYGYIVGETIGTLSVIHFVYIKNTYRGFKIAHRLLQAHVGDSLGKEELAITHISPAAAAMKDKYKLYFDPYLIEFIRKVDKQ